MRDYGGMFRGIVADVDDPEQRKRYRVRVVNVHQEEVPTDALPWAEWCVFGGKGFGDLPHFEVGDAVFVMFEQCDRRFPVIVGGWLSYGGGTNDVPNELTGDYEKNQQRWIRYDRAGNKVTMSPLDDELFVEIQSGDTTVRVRGLDGSVLIEADARVIVRAPSVQVSEADEVSVETNRLIAQVADEATVQCGDVVNLQGATTINVGTYQPPTTALIPPAPRTTGTVDVEADQLIKLQSGQAIDLDAGTDITADTPQNVIVHAQGNVTITGDAQVNVESDGPVNINAKEFVLNTDTAKVVVGAQTDLEIQAGGNVSIEAAATVAVKATGNKVTIEAGGNIEVTAGGDADVDCAGNAALHAAGFVKLESDSKIELLAPVIEIEADSLLSLTGTGTARLDGGTILIG